MSIPERVESIVAKQRAMLSSSDRPEDVLLRLRADGVPAYESLLAVEELFSIPFHEVKEMMNLIPEWRDLPVSGSTLDAAEEALRRLASDDR